MAVSSGVVTKAYRKKLADLASGQVSVPSDMTLVGGSFVIGCRGWELDGGGNKVRKAPSDTLKFVESGQEDGSGNPTVAPEQPGENYYFAKQLGALDVTDDNQGKSTVTCTVATTEGNGQDALTGTSHFYEIGVFDKSGTMVAYCTFDEQTKDSSQSLQHVIQIIR